VVVINRGVVAAADSALRMKAFGIARNNMEELLSSEEAEQAVEYGASDIYPEIAWQTTVETFYDPLTSRMWLRAVCTAEYTDTTGEIQTVELNHWLTNLTKEQVQLILQEREKEKEWMDEETIETIEEAAEYADVDVQTIKKWVNNDMRLTPLGWYIEDELDFYKEYDGHPTLRDRIEWEEARRRLMEPGTTPYEPPTIDWDTIPDDLQDPLRQLLGHEDISRYDQ